MEQLGIRPIAALSVAFNVDRCWSKRVTFHHSVILPPLGVSWRHWSRHHPNFYIDYRKNPKAN